MATIDNLQKELKVVKISRDFSKVPNWLVIDSTFTPDFVVANPRESPVWEISGAEFTHSPKHTANSISIRFPRVEKIRDDKDWKTATSLAELEELVRIGELTKRLLFKPPSQGAHDDEELFEGEPDENSLKPQHSPTKKKKSPQMGQRTLSGMWSGKSTNPESENSKPDSTFNLKPEKSEIEKSEEMEISENSVQKRSRSPVNGNSTKKQKTQKEVKPLKKVKPPKKGKTTELTMESAEPHPNFNQDITDILEALGLFEKNAGAGVKHKAYMKAATALQLLPSRVTSGKQAMKLDGVGKKIAKKIDEILETGKLAKLEKLNADPKRVAVNELCKISGIGPAMAKKLVDEHNVYKIPDLEKVKHLLNHHQEIGYKFFYEFEERIPREEIVEFEKIIQSVLPEIDPKLEATICGSYRRQKATCGDIDMLITHPSYTSDKPVPAFLKRLHARLTAKKILTDDLSLGEVQYHGVCQLPKEGALHRYSST
eukprot:TRINITY_DN8310_c0_g1_i1.p1 TRINITY_DN8310_c0_g1~~TRINITY_DN8310_c0_g1_i1.p1  ORF type:complete len:485 (+),score=219.60 TRINITY_DN8310_c0_g1_i1:116-1570(+)